MEKNNTTIIIGLLALIAGLLIGYVFGVSGNWYGNGAMNRAMDGRMAEEMTEHMDDADILARDGAMQHAMDEMMMEYRGKTGVAYEEAFLRGMIVHHMGAVRMAEELLEQTERPELVQMANDIISVQNAEIDMMQGWLSAWFNEDDNAE